MHVIALLQYKPCVPTPSANAVGESCSLGLTSTGFDVGIVGAIILQQEALGHVF